MNQKTAHLKWQYTQTEQQIQHNPCKILPGFFMQIEWYTYESHNNFEKEQSLKTQTFLF